MTQFTDLSLAEAILRAVSAEGYTTPTPIQADVIPAMLKGHDIIGIAQTGTGKTAAFVLPLLDKIHRAGKAPAPKSCNALILAPTRELAAQIAEAITVYGKNVRHSVTVVVGGAKPGPQVRALAKGVDILVATPGRLEDHVQAGALRLHDATTVILDEADQMLDLGFMPAIRRIMAKVPKVRQTILMSATMPTQIRKLGHDFLKNPVEIAVTPVSKTADRIDQWVLNVPKAEKRAMLVGLLRRETIDRSIVFTRTKHGANKVAQYLCAAGIPSSAIHGNKSQSQRERTLADFRTGDVTTLVATDIAARGIDVDGVSHVFNFELPNVAEVYVHRIGRTARAGASGRAFTLCDPEERGLLRDIEKLIGRKIDLDTEAVELDKNPPVISDARPPRPEGRGQNGRGQNSRGAAGGRTGDSAGGNSAGNSGNSRNRGRGRNGGDTAERRTDGQQPARNSGAADGQRRTENRTENRNENRADNRNATSKPKGHRGSPQRNAANQNGENRNGENRNGETRNGGQRRDNERSANSGPNGNRPEGRSNGRTADTRNTGNRNGENRNNGRRDGGRQPAGTQTATADEANLGLARMMANIENSRPKATRAS